jgi:redox-sensitive bicupin YhaK (pirin superfamily)
MSIRPIRRFQKAQPTIEGAGVSLHRAFGFGDTQDFDPFLLLDDMRNERPEDYAAGFPWHPHRGIETITYILSGTVDHADSLGNKGTIRAGGVQWMTAGNGIIHQEMPAGDAGGQLHGFQLWANLPSSLKMTAPRYQDVVSDDIPQVVDDDGTSIRVVCGSFGGVSGPVDGIAAEPSYLDVSIPPRTRKSLPVASSRHAFAYVIAGSGKFSDASQPLPVKTEDVSGAELSPEALAALSGEADNRSLIVFDSGDEIKVESGEEGMRFLLVSGKPIQEPVAWYGPVVMNTQEELQQAFDELQAGTFLKHR